MPRPGPSPLRWTVVLAAALFALSGCANGPTIATRTETLPGASPVTSTPPPIPGGRSCSDPSPAVRVKRGLEVQGRTREGDPFYALFDGVRRVPAGTPLTTYLRLPGARTVRITLIGPGDRIVRPAALRPGLPPYPWDRPGDPWTGTITFPQSGCWRVYLDRGAIDGEMWVRARG